MCENADIRQRLREMILATGAERVGFAKAEPVDAESFEVAVNGVKAYVEPAKNVALGQLYWFS